MGYLQGERGFEITTSPDTFISTRGTHFELEGVPFPIRGANNYYLPYCSDEMAEAVFVLAQRMECNVLRTWAFGDSPNLKRTIALARQYELKLILALENFWPDYGGVDKYVKALGLQDRDDFFASDSAKQAYQSHVEEVVSSCSGEAAILAWDLMNEPRCANSELLVEWTAEMSAFVKSLDEDHLVAAGDEGQHSELLLALPNVDFGTFHLYPDSQPKVDAIGFGVKAIREHLELQQRSNKPMLLEEYGCKDRGKRDSVYQAWLAEVSKLQGPGALVWMIASNANGGQLYPDYDGYTVYGPDEVPSVIAFHRSEQAP